MWIWLTHNLIPALKNLLFLNHPVWRKKESKIDCEWPLCGTRRRRKGKLSDLSLHLSLKRNLNDAEKGFWCSGRLITDFGAKSLLDEDGDLWIRQMTFQLIWQVSKEYWKKVWRNFVCCDYEMEMKKTF